MPVTTAALVAVSMASAIAANTAMLATAATSA
jgi:hypothetical protein